MTISRVGSAAVLGTSSAASGTFNATNPAGIAAGDILIVSFNVNRDCTPTTPSGFNLIRNIVDTTTTKNWVYWRLADGTAADVGSFAWTQASAVSLVVPIQVAAYRGVDNTTPILTENGVNETGAATGTHTAPSITNTDANAWGVAQFHSRGTTTPQSWTPGSGLTELQDTDGLLATANNVASELCDTNGPFATGAVAFSSTCNQSNAAATMWAAFLTPAAVSSTPPIRPARPVLQAVGRAGNY